MGKSYPVQRKKSASVITLEPHLRLAKLPLCLMVSFSTAFGYLFAKPTYSAELFFCTIGVLLLATGAASFNSIQEIQYDALMERTKDRPLVQKRLSVFQAAIQAVFLIVSGGSLLFFSLDSVGPAVVGILAIILYNLIYTKLKSITVFAIIPGTICGALPPYIGWLAAGGDVLSFGALLLFVLFVLWQVPHFFLVLLRHKKDYVNSNLPNVLNKLGESRLRRVFITWIGALAAIMLIFSVMPNGGPVLGRFLICLNAIVLFSLFVVQLIFMQRPKYRYLFLHLNISIFLVMFIISAGAVMNG